MQRLNRKLAWYVENQELLDKDAAILKQKNYEIKELKDLVERMEADRGSINMEKDKKDKERAGDARRIQDLERQVSRKIFNIWCCCVSSELFPPPPFRLGDELGMVSSGRSD